MDDKLVDLHVHTQASDGDDTPEELIAAAKERGFAPGGVLCITDHNTLGSARWAYDRRSKGSADADMTVLPGVEISAFIELDGVAVHVHIKGLGIDPYNKTLSDFCDRIDEVRLAGLARRIEYVRSRGYCVPAETQEKLMRESYWGKGDLARLLVSQGFFKDTNSAYHHLWDGLGRDFAMDLSIPASEAINAIVTAGGVSELAHPFRNEDEGGVVGREQVVARLEELVRLGVQSVEAFYSATPLEDCLFAEQLAQGRGLYVGIGSDHHSLRSPRRNRLGRTDSDGVNHADRATVLQALGL